MLDLSRFIGAEHLGDPTTDPDSWCENFKKWRDCLPVSSKTACVVLKAKVVSKHHVVITHIDQEWIAQGNGMPSSDNEWDKYFDHVIKLLPRFFRRNNGFTKESLSSVWERLEQRNLTVRQYAGEIAAVADKFERLTPPITKPVSELFAKFCTGIKPVLRLHLTGSVRDCAIDEKDDKSTALVKYDTLVQLASSYERLLNDTADAERPRRTSGHFRARNHTGLDTNTKSPPLEHTLCRSFASGRTCRYGRKCKRLHMAANEFMRHRLFSLQSEREQDLIMEIERSGATPGHPAIGRSLPRSVEAATNRVSRPPSFTAEASSTEALKAQVQQLQDQIATLMRALGPDPPLTATPVTMDGVAQIPTTHAMQAHVPIADPALSDHADSGGQTDYGDLCMTHEVPLAMSSEPESIDSPPEDEPIPNRPITHITPCSHIPVFLGRQASTHFAMILETCNEAPRSLMSYGAFADYIAPQGYTLLPPPPADGLALIACNGTQLPPVGCATLPVFFRRPGPRAVADFELSVYVMAAESGFDTDLVLCVNDLRMLGMCLHLADGWVEFSNLEPARRIKLGTGLAIPAGQRRNPSQYNARAHSLTATATLDLSHDVPVYIHDTRDLFAD